VKIPPARIDSFVRDPGADVRAVLVYGPDTGLVRERADSLLRAIVDDPADPFRVTSLSAADLAGDPARLSDEAASLSLTGGRRVVRLTEAGDAAADSLGEIMEGDPGGAFIIVQSGPLPPRSALRKLFDSAQGGASIACYADEGGGLVDFIREMLAAENLRASRDALAFLADRLGADRQLTRRELEKLVLYMAGGQDGDAAGDGPDDSAGGSSGDGGGAAEINLADAVACVGDSAAFGLDDAVYSAADGDYAGVDRVVDRLFLEGVAPVAILRAAGRHFQRLHLVAGRVAAGGKAEQAMAALRPPVFFKQKNRFRAQIGWWTGATLGRALELLTDAETQCKTTGLPDRAVCSRALMALANTAARGRRQLNSDR
jgi:DNA polymerase-3 subunit delta